MAYHQFQIGDDYIKIQYDKTKSDQAGEKVHDKHLYANPFNPLVCPFLALGIWISLEVDRLSSVTSLFGTEVTLGEAPSKRYSSKLVKLLTVTAKSLSREMSEMFESTRSSVLAIKWYPCKKLYQLFF